jgi:uncharacterized protein YycO
MKRHSILALALLLATTANAQWGHLQSGDLIFVRDTSGMGSAVQQTTGQYTHVALVERSGDTLFIIDATPTLGVSRRHLSPLTFHLSPCDVYRLTISFDTAAVITRAHSFLGQPYDNAFMHDNGALYCSELIYECFLDSAGNHLFEAIPMNWRAPDGTIPQYWLDHFNKLNTPIPEDLPGTNPTAISRSPLLRKL